MFVSSSIASRIRKLESRIIDESRLHCDNIASLETNSGPASTDALCDSFGDFLDRPGFISTFNRIRDISRKEFSSSSTGEVDEEEYELISKCNLVISQLHEEILRVFRIVRDVYKTRFPELTNVLTSPLDYVAIVRTLGNDIERVDRKLLEKILPSHLIMAVSLSSATSVGRPLLPADLSRCLEGCNVVDALNSARKEVSMFLQQRISSMIPNVAAILGPVVAAKLLSAAGDVKTLANQSSNIEQMGGTSGSNKDNSLATVAEREAQRELALSSRSVQGKGVIFECDIVASVPLDLVKKAGRLVANKVGLAARVDLARSSPLGQQGLAFKQQIESALEKLKAPPPAPLKKALPIPDIGDKKKTKRGGERHRKAKERWEMTEARKLQNRVKFGTEAEETAGYEDEEGLGMLGQQGADGRMKVKFSTKKVGMAASDKKKHLAVEQRIARGGVGGFETSIGLAGAGGVLGGGVTVAPIQAIKRKAPEGTRTS